MSGYVGRPGPADYKKTAVVVEVVDDDATLGPSRSGASNPRSGAFWLFLA
jgi:hypothetical protein